MKVYIAKTPLILQNEDGEDFRVEPGETVELTADQYQDVAAHVVAAEISDEAADSETPLEETPSGTELQSETKPVRGRGGKKEA